MKRITLAALALFATCAATPVMATAQAAPPVKIIAMELGAKQTLDSLANTARSTRTENAACLTRYSVHNDTLVLSAFGPARYAKADSVNIWVYVGAPMCQSGAPTIHSHVAYDGFPGPSNMDVATQASIGIWGMILSVRDSAWRIIVY